jgi:hypothetical protein
MHEYRWRAKGSVAYRWYIGQDSQHIPYRGKGTYLEHYPSCSQLDLILNASIIPFFLMKIASVILTELVLKFARCCIIVEDKGNTFKIITWEHKFFFHHQFSMLVAKDIGGWILWAHMIFPSEGEPRHSVKLLPCDHEVMGSSPGNSLLQKCRERLRT